MVYHISISNHHKIWKNILLLLWVLGDSNNNPHFCVIKSGMSSKFEFWRKPHSSILFTRAALGFQIDGAKKISYTIKGKKLRTLMINEISQKLIIQLKLLHHPNATPTFQWLQQFWFWSSFLSSSQIFKIDL